MINFGDTDVCVEKMWCDEGSFKFALSEFVLQAH